jgi:hypothetical protein
MDNYNAIMAVHVPKSEEESAPFGREIHCFRMLWIMVQQDATWPDAWATAIQDLTQSD